jgi:hypothetical protein
MRSCMTNHGKETPERSAGESPTTSFQHRRIFLTLRNKQIEKAEEGTNRQTTSRSAALRRWPATRSPFGFFASDDGKVQSDLYVQHLAIHGNGRFAVQVPAEGARTELSFLGNHFIAVDHDLYGLCFFLELGSSNGTR